MGQIIKYNVTKDADSGRVMVPTTVTGGYPSASTTTNPNAVSANLWGNSFHGTEDLNGSMTINGDINIVFDEEDWDDSDYDDEEGDGSETEDMPTGSLYVSGKVQASEVYVNYPNREGELVNILDLLLPVGSIIMYNGQSDVPKGWAVCDGNNGTPNLVGKFIKGVGKKADVGTTGGSATHTLTTNEMPSHSHSATSTSVSETTINVEVMNGNQTTPTDIANKYIPALDVIQEEYYDTGGSSNAIMYTGNKKGDYGLVGIKVADLVSYAGTATGSGTATTTTTTTTTIANTGGGAAFNIEPPYYTLIYIMKIS